MLLYYKFVTSQNFYTIEVSNTMNVLEFLILIKNKHFPNTRADFDLYAFNANGNIKFNNKDTFNEITYILIKRLPKNFFFENKLDIKKEKIVANEIKEKDIYSCFGDEIYSVGNKNTSKNLKSEENYSNNKTLTRNNKSENFLIINKIEKKKILTKRHLNLNSKFKNNIFKNEN
jgi:hypothetical protein